MLHHVTVFENRTDSLFMFRIPSPASIKKASNDMDVLSCKLIIVHHRTRSRTTSRHTQQSYTPIVANPTT